MSGRNSLKSKVAAQSKVTPRPSLTRRLLPLAAVTALPVLLTTELWAAVWGGVRSRAWDGSGHQALAQIYSETVFPDTFGWTNAFFGGMPHPNFYPPLFYWLVALLAHAGVPFVVAFKTVLALPPLCLPACVWLVAWRVSGKDRLAATCAAVAVVPLLVDYRFYNGTGLLTGLSYTSTFLFGLYTQPLGFVLLLAWYGVYAGERQTAARFAAAALLLALALLANFFAANVAVLLIATTVARDAFRLYRAEVGPGRDLARRRFVSRVASPAAAACLTLFWLAPVASAAAYFPSSPSRLPLYTLFSPTMTAWYVLAVAGAALWVRRRAGAAGPYLSTCALMAALVLTAGSLAPAWLPLHAERILTMLNFMLAVPVGYLLSRALLRAGLVSNPSGGRAAGLRTFYALSNAFVLLALFAVGVALITPPSFKLAFYGDGESAAIEPLLDYGREHAAGRYMVETPPFEDTETAHEGRAISAYLAAQGNEVSSVFFREASPSIIFFNSLVRSLSVYGDATNLSSVLIDDKDFGAQPVARHLGQARLLGIRYLVVRSPWARSRLDGQPGFKSRTDLGRWSVYELEGEPPARVRALEYRPALVVSGLSVKQRRDNQYEFVRLAEEQFADGWYDVLLARSPETKLDRLSVEDGFGALVIETYDCDDEDTAFARLRDYARGRTLVLLSSEAALFRRIRASLDEFPNAVVIERPAEPPGEWMEAGPPTRGYESSAVRATWREIKKVLDARKVASGAGGPEALSFKVGERSVEVEPRTAPATPAPLLIRTTYFPHWRREDGAAVYAATPFYMLTFARGPARIVFERRPLDRLGATVAAAGLLLVCAAGAWSLRKPTLRAVGRGRLAREAVAEVGRVA